MVVVVVVVAVTGVGVVVVIVVGGRRAHPHCGVAASAFGLERLGRHLGSIVTIE